MKISAAPFLSIVTISFNQKQFLRQCIESVLAQKRDDVEYIVVDPGSTDGSLELISSYGARIDRVVLGPDAGPADGLNKGFGLAAGKIGYFLNSDDFLMPHGVEVMRAFWREEPPVDVLLCGGWMVDGQAKPLRELQPNAFDLSQLLAQRGRMVQQGMSFKLERFREVGGFSADNRTCWDLDLLCRLLGQSGAAAYLPARIGAFRLHGDSLTGGAAGAKHKAKYEADHAQLVERYGVAQRRPTTLSVVPSFLRVRDWLLPRAMQRRFANDLGA